MEAVVDLVNSLTLVKGNESKCLIYKTKRHKVFWSVLHYRIYTTKRRGRLAPVSMCVVSQGTVPLRCYTLIENPSQKQYVWRIVNKGVSQTCSVNKSYKLRLLNNTSIILIDQ